MGTMYITSVSGSGFPGMVKGNKICSRMTFTTPNPRLELEWVSPGEVRTEIIEGDEAVAMWDAITTAREEYRRRVNTVQSMKVEVKYGS